MRLWEMFEAESRIDELFKGSSAVPYKVINNDADYWRAVFKVGDHKYDIGFNEIPYGELDGTPNDDWELVFSMFDDGDPVGSKVDNTGTGNEFQVYATVIAISKEFLRNKRPAIVSFSGIGHRDRLYTKLLRYLKSEAASLGYYPEVGDEVNHGFEDGHIFRLVRKDAKTN